MTLAGDSGHAAEVLAAVNRAPGAGFEMQSLRLAPIGPDEALVAVHAVGLCHTDLLCAEGVIPVPSPIVLGHEGAGIVTAVGSSVRSVGVGDRVLMSFDSCHDCPNCRHGMPAYCESFWSLNFGGSRPDGTTAFSNGDHKVHSHFFGQSSLATHSVVPARTLVGLPDDMPFEIAAPLGCGVQTGAGAILNVLCVHPGNSVIVIGVGSVGIAAVMAARLCTAKRIIVVDPVTSRRELSLSLGADVALDPHTERLADRLVELGGADYIVDTSGRSETIGACFGALRPRGTVLLVAGSATESVTVDSRQLLIGRSVRGVRMGEAVPRDFVPLLIEHWRRGRFPLERVITRYDFKDLGGALADLRDQRTVKAVLIP